jgi:hypothetical protein
MGDREADEERERTSDDRRDAERTSEEYDHGDDKRVRRSEIGYDHTTEYSRLAHTLVGVTDGGGDRRDFTAGASGSSDPVYPNRLPRNNYPTLIHPESESESGSEQEHREEEGDESEQSDDWSCGHCQTQGLNFSVLHQCSVCRQLVCRNCPGACQLDNVHWFVPWFATDTNYHQQDGSAPSSDPPTERFDRSSATSPNGNICNDTHTAVADWSDIAPSSRFGTLSSADGFSNSTTGAGIDTNSSCVTLDDDDHRASTTGASGSFGHAGGGEGSAEVNSGDAAAGHALFTDQPFAQPDGSVCEACLITGLPNHLCGMCDHLICRYCAHAFLYSSVVPVCPRCTPSCTEDGDIELYPDIGECAKGPQPNATTESLAQIGSTESLAHTGPPLSDLSRCSPTIVALLATPNPNTAMADQFGSPWRYNWWHRKLLIKAKYDNEQAMEMWFRCCEDAREDDGAEEDDGELVLFPSEHPEEEYDGELQLPEEHADEHADEQLPDEHAELPSVPYFIVTVRIKCACSLVPHFSVVGESFEC